MNFNTIEEALEDIREGRMILVVDDEDRENEGIFDGGGKGDARKRKLHGYLWKRDDMCPHDRGECAAAGTGPDGGKKYREHEDGIYRDGGSQSSTTGISAFERANTIKELANPASVSSDFTRPGHIFPLIARDGGVLKRSGHTEAAVDLARMAGLHPAGSYARL